MAYPDYFSDVAKEMRARSTSIRRDFATHRGSAGRNREDLVSRFLIEHLPKAFLVENGLVISASGAFSNQADVVIVDHLNNAPLHASRPEKLWPAEAVYALFEVKTLLSPSELADAVAKCRRFKSLERHFSESASTQRISSSLFILWAYDSPSSETAKENIIAAFQPVPPAERPDFVIVPDRLVAISGEYMELCKLGHPTSQHRQALHKHHGPDLGSLLPECAEVNDFGEDSLLAWYVWFDSWLRRAGSRSADPLRYLPPIKNWGRRV